MLMCTHICMYANNQFLRIQIHLNTHTHTHTKTHTKECARIFIGVCIYMTLLITLNHVLDEP